MLCEICNERETDGPNRLWCSDCGLAIAYLARRLGPTVAREILASRRGRPLGADEYVNHLDGDPTDNRPENLAIVSARGEGIS